MIIRRSCRTAIDSSFALTSSLAKTQCRFLHARMPQRRIPSPTPFVPDAKTFLTLIGRNLSQHAAKIPSWEALFSLTSKQLRELGVEPARSRRYLLHWREKFRNGLYGTGGDLQEVSDGVAELRVVEVKSPGAKATVSNTPGTVKKIVNVPLDSPAPPSPIARATPVQRFKLLGAHAIAGPHIEPVKGAGGMVARLRVKEGLWEDRRGHKVDGGERRKAEVRAKRRAAERKAG